MSEAIEAVLHRHRELLLRTDVRAYPSRSFKEGASWQHLEPMSDLIVDLVNTGKLLQTQVEKAIGKLDISMKGAIKMLVKRTSLVYDACKGLAFVLRLMAAHLLMKRQAWADSKKLGTRLPAASNNHIIVIIIIIIIIAILQHYNYQHHHQHHKS